jgi:hypothetical protein
LVCRTSVAALRARRSSSFSISRRSVSSGSTSSLPDHFRNACVRATARFGATAAAERQERPATGGKSPAGWDAPTCPLVHRIQGGAPCAYHLAAQRAAPSPSRTTIRRTPISVWCSHWGAGSPGASRTMRQAGALSSFPSALPASDASCPDCAVRATPPACVL